MKRIDTGNSSFEKLIKSDNIYVDKTRYLFDLLTDGGTYYFLSRPRRFGKTLAVDTLEQIFKGRRELFKGLYIDSTEYDWKEYPVIHIDFGKCQKTTALDLKGWIGRKIIREGENFGITLDSTLDYDENFDILIEKLSKREKVVVLIDEYDKLLSSNIYNPEVESIRNVLKGFFEVIKASYSSLRFVFITGVTKYAKLSVFSSMNNLRDYTMSHNLSTAFGYTEEELERYFCDYIEKGTKITGEGRKTYLDKLKYMYDGYRFAPGAETVYNPVSIGSFFGDGGDEFNSYWIDTGGTKILTDIAKKVKFNIAEDLKKPVSKSKISSFDIIEMTTGRITSLKYKSLLLQSGYLTILNTEKKEKELYLGFPNEEVRQSFSMKLLEVYGGEEAEDNFDGDNLFNQFSQGNTEGVIDNLYSVYASIPYREEQKIIEADYQGMFYAMMIVAHADVNLEEITNKGRIDAVVKTPGHVYVIEFKRDESADKALEQIKNKGYWEKYKAWSNNSSRRIHLLGINFSTEERNITEWKEETLEWS